MFKLWPLLSVTLTEHLNTSTLESLLVWELEELLVLRVSLKRVSTKKKMLLETLVTCFLASLTTLTSI